MVHDAGIKDTLLVARATKEAPGRKLMKVRAQIKADSATSATGQRDLREIEAAEESPGRKLMKVMAQKINTGSATSATGRRDLLAVEATEESPGRMLMKVRAQKTTDLVSATGRRDLRQWRSRPRRIRLVAS